MRSFTLPGDKSISHRALIFAAVSTGRARIRGVLPSADVASTAEALTAMGVAVPVLDQTEMVISGVGRRGLSAPQVDLDCGNSGTTARLLAGLLAGAGLPARLIGDASLSARPMRRVAEPLRAMGADVTTSAAGGLPIALGSSALHSLTWRSEVPSAQVKSALLLAGLVAEVRVAVDEPVPTRDHTERMLRAAGVDVHLEGTQVVLEPADRIALDTIEIPGDCSSSAFLIGLALLGGSPALALRDIGVNPGRTGAIDALRRMGASIRFESERGYGEEPVATIIAEPSALRGITIGGAEIPALIDELPLLACVAARAEGETRVSGAGELRVKESDRIRAVVENLRAVGAEAEELADGFVVRGSDRPLRGTVRTHGDHRIAMAFGVLGALPGSAITLDAPSCVRVSWPTFWDTIADATRF
ncbi:MAG: 3-phosphoshikimate 1-carboxyvinyltransferase [Gemmatimonadetes bacterium]|nr:3-phosphoshikimate 1-carboxyvinyltransferase [Gemmatimonadota bacterium]MBM4190733.1 3-phosphoshikimate 1-carboxyvinyltransferase [Gemmatimonadota bacterium]